MTKTQTVPKTPNGGASMAAHRCRSRPTQPTQPTQPNQPNQPTQPRQPNEPKRSQPLMWWAHQSNKIPSRTPQGANESKIFFHSSGQDTVELA